jgi:hypothetical protein
MVAKQFAALIFCVSPVQMEQVQTLVLVWWDGW